MSDTVLIWDLDGTLLDSYTVMVESLDQTLKENGVTMDKTAVLKYVTEKSVNSFIKELEKEKGIPFDKFHDRYLYISEQRVNEVKPIRHAIELLEILKDRGIRSFVYTHKGDQTFAILKNLKLDLYFEEVITALNGFKRKPDPEGIDYLVNKYRLDRKDVFYIGDRSLDVECSLNANVRSILYLQEGSFALLTGKEDIIVHDLIEIADVI